MAPPPLKCVRVPWTLSSVHVYGDWTRKVNAGERKSLPHPGDSHERQALRSLIRGFGNETCIPFFFASMPP